MTVTACVALSGGTPLSVKTMRMALVLGPCATVGVHMKMPRLVSMLAPGGGARSDQRRVLAGRSESLPETANARGEPSLTTLVPGAAMTGAVLISLITTVT